MSPEKLDLPTKKKVISRDYETVDNKRSANETADNCDHLYDQVDFTGNSLSPSSTKSKNSPIRKSDSFRIATQLNRIDSQRGNDAVRNRFKARKDQRRHIRNNAESNSHQTVRDDGYVNVSFGNTGLETLSGQEASYDPRPSRWYTSSDSDNDSGDYVTLSGISSNESAAHNQSDIFTQHQNVCYALNNHTKLSNAQRLSYDGANSLPNAFLSKPFCDRNPLHKSNSFQLENIHGAATYRGNLFRGSSSSYNVRHSSAIDTLYDNYAAAIYGNLIGPGKSRHRMCSKDPPSRFHENVNQDPSARVEEDCLESDSPWIMHPDVSDNRLLNSVPKTSLLRKSNSLSSMHDSLEDMRYKRFRANRRKSAKKLVFSNRSAFLIGTGFTNIEQDIETDRLLSRLGTPPREACSNNGLNEQVSIGRERGRVISRYGTPPREGFKGNSKDPEKSHVLQSNLSHNLEDMQYCVTTPESPHSKLAHCSNLSLDDICKKIGSLPRSESGLSTHSSVSSHTSTEPSTSSSIPNSPSFLANETLVDSFRNVVFNLTSRIAGKRGSRTERVPTRSNSASKLEDLRVRSPTPPPVHSAGYETEIQRAKKSKFVYNLARAYSMRIKGNKQRLLDRKGHGDTAGLAQQLASLLKDNRQGGTNIGARMASNQPLVLASYTLSKLGCQWQNPTIAGVPAGFDPELLSFNTEGLCRNPNEIQETNSEQLTGSTSETPQEPILPPSIEDRDLERDMNIEQTAPPGADNPVITDESSLYFYERKFLDDLESNFGVEDEVFRDSAVYSDDGSWSIGGEAPNLRLSIRDKVQLIEKRNKAKPVPKIEIKCTEKAHTIKEIMKCLETNTSYVKECQEAKMSRDSSGITHATQMVSDRARELEECATLARIRQNSQSIRPHSQLSIDESDVKPHDDVTQSPAKKGWVKEVVSLLESDECN